jgi:crotonobetainyl-CoA:carnitine CoA-transferase CaiB-like acyl-CoA transferase
MNDTADTSEAKAPPALAGLRVLELSRFLPGGLATQMLGDLGADVVKIEQPGIGDPMRQFPPMGRQDSGTFLIGNRNKRSVTVDLKTAEGRKIVQRMADQADVIVEGFRPGVAERLGLGEKELRARNPRLVYCAISGYGRDGPYRDIPGHDMNYLGITGMLQLVSRPGIGPMVPGPLIADIAGGTMMAVYGILAALVGRGVSGKGQFVDVSMTDGSMHLMHSHAPDFLIGGREPIGGEQRVAGGSAPYNIYECADGKHITLGIIEEHFWDRLHALVGRADLPRTPFPDPEATLRARGILTEFFRGKTRDEWVEVLWGIDVPAGPVNSLEEAFADPQMQAREMLLHVEHPVEGRIPQIGFPVKFSETPAAISRPPPMLGEHTDEVLAELGYSTDELAQFRSAGAI